MSHREISSTGTETIRFQPIVTYNSIYTTEDFSVYVTGQASLFSKNLLILATSVLAQHKATHGNKHHFFSSLFSVQQVGVFLASTIHYAQRQLCRLPEVDGE